MNDCAKVTGSVTLNKSVMAVSFDPVCMCELQLWVSYTIGRNIHVCLYVKCFRFWCDCGKSKEGSFMPTCTGMSEFV